MKRDMSKDTSAPYDGSSAGGTGAGGSTVLGTGSEASKKLHQMLAAAAATPSPSSSDGSGGGSSDRQRTTGSGSTLLIPGTNNNINNNTTKEYPTGWRKTDVSIQLKDGHMSSNYQQQQQQEVNTAVPSGIQPLQPSSPPLSRPSPRHEGVKSISDNNTGKVIESVTGQALWDFAAVMPNELALKAGDTVTITHNVDSCWWFGMLFNQFA